MKFKKILLFSLVGCIFIYCLSKYLLKQDYRTIFSYWNKFNSSKQKSIEHATRIIQQNKRLIIKVANEYEIDPIIIAGIIYTENCLNQNPSNYFEEYYLKQFILTKNDSELQMLSIYTDSLLNNSKLNTKEIQSRFSYALIWTVGICKVSIINAIHMEKGSSLYSNREKRNTRGVIESLLNPEENLRYCTYYLHEIKSKYKKIAKIDLDNKPEILLTAYNIGDIDRLVREYQVTPGKTPTANSFGNFFIENYTSIKNILNSN